MLITTQLEFIRLANEFIRNNPNNNKNQFIEFLLKDKKLSNKNSEVGKFALESYQYVKRNIGSKIDQSKWMVGSSYVYDPTEEAVSPKDLVETVVEKCIKRQFEDIDMVDGEPKLKKMKRPTLTNDKDFSLFSDKDLEDNLSDLIMFPQSIVNKMEDLLKLDSKKAKRITISGPSLCGKTTLILYLCQRFNFQYASVSKYHIENMVIGSFHNAVEKLAEEHPKILLHFNMNWCSSKAAENFKYEPFKRFSSNVVVIYESNDLDPLRKCSQFSVSFPNVGILERKRYLEHFLSRYNTEKSLCFEKMAKLTPGYQIGDIENLCLNLIAEVDRSQSTITESNFNNLLTGGSVKQQFVERERVSWNDIGGHDEVKEKLMNIIKDLLDENHPFKNNGVILHGPPGCGKTMLAKALSNELEFTFIPLCCTDILSKYQGESERNVREIFNGARSSQPCILFIDEIDALCSERDDDNHGSKNNIVNVFLTEIDGISSHRNSKVLVIGATNFMEKIDKAISRSGRLGRHIEVNIPKSEEQRYAVLLAASKNGTKPKFGPNTSEGENNSAFEILKTISRDEQTEGWNHSDLASLINEAYNHMRSEKAHDGEEFVTIDHFLSAVRSKKLEKKINNRSISPEFDQYTQLTFIEEIVDPDNLNAFQFNEQIMISLDQTVRQHQTSLKQLIIGGRKFCGKSTLINLIAKKYQYNIVKFMSGYFKHFNHIKFCQEIGKFVKKNGPTLVHIDEKDARFELMLEICNSLKLEDATMKVLLVLETPKIHFRKFVIPNFTEDELLSLISSNLSGLPLTQEVDLASVIKNIRHWTNYHFSCLRRSVECDSEILQDDLVAAINDVNMICQ